VETLKVVFWKVKLEVHMTNSFVSLLISIIQDISCAVSLLLWLVFVTGKNSTQNKTRLEDFYNESRSVKVEILCGIINLWTEMHSWGRTFILDKAKLLNILVCTVVSTARSRYYANNYRYPHRIVVFVELCSTKHNLGCRWAHNFLSGQ
jgi:hypothetical protein